MAVTGEEIQQIAEKTAAILSESMFRLAPQAREILDSTPGGSWVWPLGNGAFQGSIEVRFLPDGMRLILKSADGSQLWDGTVVM